MKFTKMVAISLLALASVPAAAQSDVGAVVGATVYGSDAGEIGKILEVGPDYVIVDTGAHQATLPTSSLGKGAKGPLVGLTKAELDAFVEKATAEADAKLATALVAGNAIHSSDGLEIGKVREVDADGNVVIDREAGAISLPKSQFTVDANGGPALLFTKAQLDAAIGG